MKVYKKLRIYLYFTKSLQNTVKIIELFKQETRWRFLTRSCDRIMAAMAEESEDVDLSQEQTEKLLQFQVCQTE